MAEHYVYVIVRKKKKKKRLMREDFCNRYTLTIEGRRQLPPRIITLFKERRSRTYTLASDLIQNIPVKVRFFTQLENGSLMQHPCT